MRYERGLTNTLTAAPAGRKRELKVAIWYVPHGREGFSRILPPTLLRWDVKETEEGVIRAGTRTSYPDPRPYLSAVSILLQCMPNGWKAAWHPQHRRSTSLASLCSSRTLLLLLEGKRAIGKGKRQRHDGRICGVGERYG